MKKKYFGVMLAAAMMAQPLMVLAAENPSANANVVVRPSRDNGSGSSSSSKPLDTTSSSGAGLTGGVTGTAAAGVILSQDTTTGGVVSGGTVSGGNVSEGGAAGSGSTSISVGETIVRFATNEENKTTFSEKVVETINTINSGTTPLYRAIGTPEVVGYNPLIPVQTLVAEDAATQTKKTEPVTVTLYVPNLVENLNNVQILYYNGETKKWEFMAPTAVDFTTKQISVQLKGDTPFTVVYKNN